MKENAVRCGAHLMEASFRDFARRLIVVCVEDAVLHPDLPLVAWAMMAESRGYQAPPALAAALLRILYELAACGTYDAEPVLAAAGGAAREEPDAGALAAEDAALVRSLLARAAFGGMRGDVRMLREAARIWCARLRCSSGRQMMRDAYAGCGITQSGLASLIVQPLRREHVPPSAIDFHCTDMLKHCRCEGFCEEDVKLAVWYFRSSENSKVRALPASAEEERQRARLRAVWEAVAHSVEVFSKTYLARRFPRG